MRGGGGGHGPLAALGPGGRLRGALQGRLEQADPDGPARRHLHGGLLQRVEPGLLETGQARGELQPQRGHRLAAVALHEPHRPQRLRGYGLLRLAGGGELGRAHDEALHVQAAGPAAADLPGAQQRHRLRRVHGHSLHGPPRRLDRRVRGHDALLQGPLLHLRRQRRRLHPGRGMLRRLPANAARRPRHGPLRPAAGHDHGQLREPGRPEREPHGAQRPGPGAVHLGRHPRGPDDAARVQRLGGAWNRDLSRRPHRGGGGAQGPGQAREE
mmetsp:Transcript_56898/g.161515  ORF Transcript_56898/g.161515 Transcript_56898/m.161515 type:complete len:270 (-) Transcript_56898:1090-1899(-)